MCLLSSAAASEALGQGRGSGLRDRTQDRGAMRAEDLILSASTTTSASRPTCSTPTCRPGTKDQAPRVVEDESGVQQWWYGDIRGPQPRTERGGGQAAGDFNIDPSRYEEMRPGCYDVHERVRDMNAGGQLAGLNFPNWTGFSGQVLNQGPDPDCQRDHDQGLQRLARRRMVRRLPRPLHPVRAPAAVRRRAGGRRDPPAGGQGLPRRHLLREPEALQMPASTRTTGTPCSRPPATRAPSCAPTSARPRRSPPPRRRPAERGHGHLAVRLDLHPGRPAVVRLLGALPRPAVLA